jgi:Hemerythrin HHE cation binding domain
MPTRAQLEPLVRAGASYEEVAARFGIPPGQAYLIVTGLPADGSDVLGPEWLASRTGVLEGSSQHLSNPPTEVPTDKPGVAAWRTGRARADRAMQAAAAARTATPPPIDEPEKTDDVVDVLGRQHNQVKYLQEQLEAIPAKKNGGTAEHVQRRVSILDMMRMRLAAHEAAEEEYLWPAVRSGVPDGDALADQAIGQEKHGDELLAALDGMTGDEEQFDELVDALMSALRKHVAFEDKVFLAVKEHLPAEQRDELGRKVQAAGSKTPTRQHPHSPPGNRAADRLAAPLDRMRDSLGTRPADREGRVEFPAPDEPGDD